jgi:hypothetical protein
VSFLRRLLGGGEEPLTGGSASRRQKTYSADSGYVYLYSFAGFRETERKGERGYEYVFDVSPNRREWFPVAVFLGRPVLDAWHAAHRELTASERFAIAKIALRRAFDAHENPADLRAGVKLDPDDMEAVVETLGLL